MSARGAKGTCDLYFGKVVRARGNCERCGSAGPLECAHIIRRSFVGDPDGVALRHNEDNAWCLCVACHDLVDEHKPIFTALVAATIGLDKHDELFAVAHGRHRPWRESDWILERQRLLALLKASA